WLDFRLVLFRSLADSSAVEPVIVDVPDSQLHQVVSRRQTVGGGIQGKLASAGGSHRSALSARIRRLRVCRTLPLAEVALTDQAPGIGMHQRLQLPPAERRFERLY